MTAFSKEILAWSRDAREARYWFFKRPPVNRGPARLPARLQAFPDPVSSDSCGLMPPSAPVREIVGKKFALATPTLALAEIRFCSASRRSGRRSNNVAGKPAGTSGGSY